MGGFFFLQAGSPTREGAGTREQRRLRRDERTNALKAVSKAANEFHDTIPQSGHPQTQVISDSAAMLQARINLAEKAATAPAGSRSSDFLNRLLRRELKKVEKEDESNQNNL